MAEGVDEARLGKKFIEQMKLEHGTYGKTCRG